ncbi:hypothetical protein B0A49_01835 [Cryomyces minteri]|uniref:SAP domain-containing protein n=1 Tax=Cryomyces minteri TaxID=331657 RepID=A0A4U0XJ93_9PEZI|nr:hypothetical protein B0A49_01835 [Cryomyces minteri]
MPPGQNMDDIWTVMRSGMWRLQYKLSPEGKKRFFQEFLPLLHDTKHSILGARDDDSYYLVYVGTKAKAQKNGYAKKLIDYVTKKADEESRACYLESSNAINPIIYRKLGFEIARKIHLQRGEANIELDIMVREPKSLPAALASCSKEAAHRDGDLEEQQKSKIELTLTAGSEKVGSAGYKEKVDTSPSEHDAHNDNVGSGSTDVSGETNARRREDLTPEPPERAQAEPFFDKVGVEVKYRTMECWTAYDLFAPPIPASPLTSLAVTVAEKDDSGGDLEEDEPVRASQTRKTRSQTQRLAAMEDDEDEDHQPDDGLVPCPMCKSRMKEESVFLHLDHCTGQWEQSSGRSSRTRPPTKALQNGPSQPPPKPQERIAELNYSLLKDTAMRKKLQELGIPASGPKQLLIRRHTEWVNLWNSNCDSTRSRPKRDLLHELDIWERSQGGGAPSNAADPNRPGSIMRKDFDGQGWAESNRDDFLNLIASARRKKSAPLAMEEKKEEGGQEPLATTSSQTICDRVSYEGDSKAISKIREKVEAANEGYEAEPVSMTDFKNPHLGGLPHPQPNGTTYRPYRGNEEILAKIRNDARPAQPAARETRSSSKSSSPVYSLQPQANNAPPPSPQPTQTTASHPSHPDTDAHLHSYEGNESALSSIRSKVSAANHPHPSPSPRPPPAFHARDPPEASPHSSATNAVPHGPKERRRASDAPCAVTDHLGKAGARQVPMFEVPEDPISDMDGGAAVL